jgi:hypothetical protein
MVEALFEGGHDEPDLIEARITAAGQLAPRPCGLVELPPSINEETTD